MKEANEVKAFNACFDEEVKEIMAVTGAGAFSGASVGQEKPWTASINLTAWKLIGSDEICTKKYFLQTKADGKYLRELQGKVWANSIVTLKVRQSGDVFLLVKILENQQKDKELAKILKEQIKPVVYRDQTLGKFTLNKETDIFEGKAKWNKKNVELTIEKYVGKRLEAAFAVANELVKEQEMWDKKIKELAAKKLLKVKNESWLDEDEKEMTAEQFIRKLKVESIEVSLKNKFEFYLDDGDIFRGHCIIVSGNLGKGALRAGIGG